MIRALILKDVTLYFRNRFFALVSGLGVVVYVAIYFLLPKDIDETLLIGLYPPVIPEIFEEELAEGGLVFETADSEEAVRQAMLDGEYNVAFLLPEDFTQKVATRQAEDEEVVILFTSDFPEDIREAYVVILEELAFIISGQELSIEATEEVVGVDLAGAPLAVRDRMIPLFALFILLIETMGLATLISTEVEQGTLGALLTTPVKVTDLFLSKGVMGVSMAFVQVVAVVALIGGLQREPLLVLLTLLLGCILMTGVAFLVASVAKDLMAVFGWTIPMILVLAVPAFGILIPGTTTNWSKAIPSYYLIETLHRVVNFGMTWGDVGQNLLVLAGFSVVLIGLGILALRRKFS